MQNFAPWSAYRLPDWGYGLMEFDAEGTELNWSFIQSSTGKIVDTMRILKK